MSVYDQRTKFIYEVDLAIISKDVNSEQVALELLGDIAMLAFKYGCTDLVASQQADGTELSQYDRHVAAYKYAQAWWELAVDYCKDVHSVELHPLGMIMLLYNVTKQALENPELSEKDRETNNIQLRALVEVVDKIMKVAEEDIKPDQVVGVPEIDNYQGKPETLVAEYFRCLTQIGTFYRDRDKYESDDKRVLHDRIVAIYNKIASTPM